MWEEYVLFTQSVMNLEGLTLKWIKEEKLGLHVLFREAPAKTWPQFSAAAISPTVNLLRRSKREETRNVKSKSLFILFLLSLLYTSILWHQQKYHNNHSIFKESSWVFSGRLFHWLLLHSRLNTINKSEHDSWFGGCMHVNNGASLLSFLSS